MLLRRDCGSSKLTLRFTPILMRYHRRSLTPPVDRDKKNKESRQLKAGARKEFEKTGYPPCYPPGVNITTRNIRQKFQAIMDY